MSFRDVEFGALREYMRSDKMYRYPRLLGFFPLGCLAVFLLCSGCAPWVQDNLEGVDNSILLRKIQFSKRINGQFEESFGVQGEENPGPDALGTIADTDALLENMGSSESLSKQAEEFLQKDSFYCNSQACTRDFSVSRSFGSAFLATPTLFTQEHKSIRKWNFTITKKRIGSHFLFLSYKEIYQ